MTRWERLRKRIRSWGAKIKRWFLAVLASLGLVTAVIIAAGPITYTAATEYEDGTPLPLAEIAETRLYCNGNLELTELGADGELDIVLPVGDNICYATHVATNGQESEPSNSITVKVMSSAKPNAPVSLTR